MIIKAKQCIYAMSSVKKFNGLYTCTLRQPLLDCGQLTVASFLCHCGMWLVKYAQTHTGDLGECLGPLFTVRLIDHGMCP